MSDDILRPDFHTGATDSLTFKKNTSVCRHRGVQVDKSQREVSCIRCDAILDPFQVLVQYADNERVGKYLDRQLNLTEDRIESLKKEEKKIKARIRMAKDKASKQGVLF